MITLQGSDGMRRVLDSLITEEIKLLNYKEAIYGIKIESS